jgi:hypothetical protein
MGLNNENARRLVFDIETAPIADAAEFLEPAEAPANYKDPAKIAAYIDEKNAENLGRCALDIDLCRVVAIGLRAEDGDASAVLTPTVDEERSALALFWHDASTAHLVGFNCLAFDLPVLMRRSQYLGIAIPSIAIDKYRHPSVTDLQMVLSFNGAVKLRGLSFYAKRFGIPCEDTLTGAEIPAAVVESRWDDVRAHVMADVQKTAALAQRLGHFSPALVGAVA